MNSEIHNVGIGSIVYDPNDDRLYVTCNSNGEGQGSEIAFDDLKKPDLLYFNFPGNKYTRSNIGIGDLGDYWEYRQFVIGINAAIPKFRYLFERVKDGCIEHRHTEYNYWHPISRIHKGE